MVVVLGGGVGWGEEEQVMEWARGGEDRMGWWVLGEKEMWMQEYE